MIRFDVTKEEKAFITQIVDRAMPKFPRGSISRMTLEMDITATHCNGTPLRLTELLSADDFNFLHDVGGIIRHIDRSTGKLTGCFLPRFASPEDGQ